MSLLLDHYARSLAPSPAPASTTENTTFPATETVTSAATETVTSAAPATAAATRAAAPRGQRSETWTRLAARGEQHAPVLDLVVPVYNEVHTVASSVRRLHGYLSQSFPGRFRITVVDSASTDGTPTIVRLLHRDLDRVAAIRLPQQGRGRALRAAWSTSDAQVLAYTDANLSTDLSGLLPLLAPLLSGHSDLSIGSRLARGARVSRGPKRELTSRCYNLLLRTVLRARFSDARCGFKAITADAARALLPLVRDEAWFFDTELLVLAERAGLRIYEIPVDWTDDPDSRVRLLDTACRDLAGIWRLATTLPRMRAQLAVAEQRTPRRACPTAVL